MGKNMDNTSFKVSQFEVHPMQGHAIYDYNLEIGGAFLAISLISTHNIPTIIKSASIHAKIISGSEVIFDGDLETVVELDALEPGQADVIQSSIPNRLLVAEGFQPLNDARVEFVLTVKHGEKGKRPVTFTHPVSMRIISTKPIPPEINVQFRHD